MSLLKKLFGGGGSDRVLSHGDYVCRYADYVGRRLPGIPVEAQVGADAATSHVAWKKPGGIEARQYFGNYYTRFVGGEPLDQLMSEQMDEALALDSPAEAPDPRQLLPVIKPVEWVDIARRQIQGSGLDPARAAFIIRPLVADLVVAYALDTDAMMQFVTSDLLEELGLDEARLHETALANLARKLPEMEIKGHDGRYVVRLDRNYDASMLLILDQWRDRVPIDGPILLAVPARDEVLIGDAGDPDIAESLAEIAQEIVAQSPYALSSQVLRWSDGRLAALDVDCGGPSVRP